MTPEKVFKCSLKELLENPLDDAEDDVNPKDNGSSFMFKLKVFLQSEKAGARKLDRSCCKQVAKPYYSQPHHLIRPLLAFSPAVHWESDTTQILVVLRWGVLTSLTLLFSTKPPTG